MRKVTAGLFVSLDGVVEAPERWQLPYFNDEMGEAAGAAMAATDAMLLGRLTYQEFASYWPVVSAEDQPFAGHMNNTPNPSTSSRVPWKGRSSGTIRRSSEVTSRKRFPD